MSDFFIDLDNSGGSLANFIFRGYSPCLIEVSENYLNCLTNRGTIEFNIARGELSKVDRRFPITDISMLPELFRYDYDYFSSNFKFDRSITVFLLEFWFEGFLKGGSRGLGKFVYDRSEGRFDYAKSKHGDWAFWFLHRGEWQRASLPGILDYVSETSAEVSPDDCKDNYLWEKYSKHHGIQLMRYCSLNF